MTFPPEVLSPAEAVALMDACADSPAGARNRALIAVLYRTGLRITEALALAPEVLDLEAGAVRVLRGKGGAPRTVGIDAGAAPSLGRGSTSGRHDSGARGAIPPERRSSACDQGHP